MTVTSDSSGSQTATLDTEHTLATISTQGVYSLWVDTNAMVGGSSPDITRIKVYGKARTGDTERLLDIFQFKGVQARPLFRSPLYETPHHLKFTLEQTDGTGRAYPWEVRKIA